ncbi:MAG: hypothetical protein HYR67_04995 [Bacteroidetes bacterium]|nr:hypothetical protein [Bacteroidota bacterium]
MFFTSTKSKWINFWWLLLCVAFQTPAQVTQTRRFEIPINQDFESYQIVPLDSSGIILYRNYTGPKENQLELLRVDTALNQVWKGFLPVAKDFSFASARESDGKVYFFFKGTPFNKGYLVLVVNVKDGSYFSIAIKNLIPFNATEFVASRGSILIGGYFNYRPIVLHYSMSTAKSRILPGFLNELGELIQLKTYSNGNVDVLISAKNSSRRKCIWIRHFDGNGDLLKTIILEPEENKHLIFGRAAKMVDDNQIIAGVYGRNSAYVRGVFVADVNVYGEYKIHYYNFADLKNFFHYLKAKREKRIKDRIERRKIKGKKIKFNYRLMVHELIPYNDQFIMLGEAFFPRYSNRSSSPMANSSYSPWTYGMQGPYYRVYGTDQVFDGYQYTHAVAIGFDKNANLIWDNSFEINGIKVNQLEQFVKIFPTKDHIVLAYIFENAIRTKIIKADQVIEGTAQNSIGTNDEKEVAHTQEGKLEYWYGNHFFVHGVQLVKNQNNTRRVFFITKLIAH